MRIINWFQIPAQDLERAVNFYTAVLKASFHRMGNELGQHAFFALNSREPALTGGEIVQAPQNRPSTDGVIIYLNAPDGVDAALGRVEKAGGTILLPQTSIGENGWIALIQDTEGNRIGIHSL